MRGAMKLKIALTLVNITPNRKVQVQEIKRLKINGMMEFNKKIDSIIDCLTEPDGGNAVNESDIRDAISELNELRKFNLLNLHDGSGSALLKKAKQMRMEQQYLIDTYAERYNSTELGTLKGIDRIVKLIESHYR
jgi:hypothetical protein